MMGPDPGSEAALGLPIARRAGVAQDLLCRVGQKLEPFSEVAGLFGAVFPARSSRGGNEHECLSDCSCGKRDAPYTMNAS